MVDQIMALPEGARIQVLAPVVRGRKGEHKKEFENAKRSGFVRVRADGILYDLSEEKMCIRDRPCRFTGYTPSTGSRR